MMVEGLMICINICVTEVQMLKKNIPRIIIENGVLIVHLVSIDFQLLCTCIIFVMFVHLNTFL